MVVEQGHRRQEQGHHCRKPAAGGGRGWGPGAGRRGGPGGGKQGWQEQSPGCGML